MSKRKRLGSVRGYSPPRPWETIGSEDIFEDFGSGLSVGFSVYWADVSDMYGCVRGGLKENEYLEK